MTQDFIEMSFANWKMLFVLNDSSLSQSFFIPSFSRYKQYVEDAYVAFLKKKGQAEQVIL